MGTKDAEGLAALEARLARALALLQEPAASWVPPTHGPDGKIALDVAIVGAGMAGLAAGLALRREGIERVALFDAAEAGDEGPWPRYARMQTLRSPKALAGPALGLPELTFRAWFEAQYGGHAWEALDKIPTAMWMAYLRWYRRVAGLIVHNAAAIRCIEPAAGLFRLLIANGGTIYSRHVVLATGRDGLGAPRIPPGFAPAWRGKLWAHSADAIDFSAFSGRSVVVVGGGASAFDNAATALEAGAASLIMLLRRPFLPRVNASKALDARGFWHGWWALPAAWRWRLLGDVEQRQTPPPREAVRRLAAHAKARLITSAPIEEIHREGDSLLLHTPRGKYRADFVILATGFVQDIRLRPELASFAEAIRLWGDAYHPPPEEQDEALALYPWLDEGFAFTEKMPGTAPYLARLHCFTYAATLSHGKVSGDIPAISAGAARLARHIAARLLSADIVLHAARLAAYTEPEFAVEDWSELVPLVGAAPSS